MSINKEQNIIETPEVTEAPSVTPEEFNEVPETTPELKSDYEIRIDAKLNSGTWTAEEGQIARKLFTSPVKPLKTLRNANLKVSSSVGKLLSVPLCVGLYESPEELVYLNYNLQIGYGPLANLDNSGNCIFNGDTDFQKMVLDGYPTNRATAIYLQREKLEEKGSIERTPFGIEIQDKSMRNAKNKGELVAAIKNILSPNRPTNNAVSSIDLCKSMKSIKEKLDKFIARKSEFKLTDPDANSDIVDFLDSIIELAPQLKKLVNDNK